MNLLLKTNAGRDRGDNVVILECFICRWEGCEVGTWERWEGSKVTRWEKLKGS